MLQIRVILLFFSGEKVVKHQHATAPNQYNHEK